MVVFGISGFGSDASKDFINNSLCKAVVLIPKI